MRRVGNKGHLERVVRNFLWVSLVSYLAWNLHFLPTLCVDTEMSLWVYKYHPLVCTYSFSMHILTKKRKKKKIVNENLLSICTWSWAMLGTWHMVPPSSLYNNPVKWMVLSLFLTKKETWPQGLTIVRNGAGIGTSGFFEPEVQVLLLY